MVIDFCRQPAALVQSGAMGCDSALGSEVREALDGIERSLVDVLLSDLLAVKLRVDPHEHA